MSVLIKCEVVKTDIVRTYVTDVNGGVWKLACDRSIRQYPSNRTFIPGSITNLAYAPTDLVNVSFCGFSSWFRVSDMSTD